MHHIGEVGNRFARTHESLLALPDRWRVPLAELAGRRITEKGGPSLPAEVLESISGCGVGESRKPPHYRTRRTPECAIFLESVGGKSRWRLVESCQVVIESVDRIAPAMLSSRAPHHVKLAYE